MRLPIEEPLVSCYLSTKGLAKEDSPNRMPPINAPPSTQTDIAAGDRRRGDRRMAPSEHTNTVLSALLEISNYVGSVMVLDEILKKIVDVTCRVMDAQSCSIYLW